MTIKTHRARTRAWLPFCCLPFLYDFPPLAFFYLLATCSRYNYFLKYSTWHRNMTSQSLASQRNKDYKLRHTHLLRRVCSLRVTHTIIECAPRNFVHTTYSFPLLFSLTHIFSHARALAHISRLLFLSLCRADDYSQTLGPEYFCIIFLFVTRILMSHRYTRYSRLWTLDDLSLSLSTLANGHERGWVRRQERTTNDDSTHFRAKAVALFTSTIVERSPSEFR